MTEVLKPHLLQVWEAEVAHQQRLLYKLTRDLEELEYFDEEIWTKITTSVSKLAKVNNLTFFDQFWRTFKHLHETPSSPFFQKFKQVLASL
mmetsp:Transcript_41186/g.30286  ORF Transcript_41186/g.30286 Transcript_41186/m.30286 type:complete len:91 (+) Transcript_41186:570-842(+)